MGHHDDQTAIADLDQVAAIEARHREQILARERVIDSLERIAVTLKVRIIDLRQRNADLQQRNADLQQRNADLRDLIEIGEAAAKVRDRIEECGIDSLETRKALAEMCWEVCKTDKPEEASCQALTAGLDKLDEALPKHPELESNSTTRS